MSGSMAAVLLLWLACAAPPPCEALPPLPASEAEATAQIAAGSVYSNRTIRAMYQCRVREIPTQDARLAATGANWEARALAAYEARRSARLLARAMMTDRYLVQQLRDRDLATYGDADGPSFAQLVERGRAKGASGDDVYRAIVESAARTNEGVAGVTGL